MKREIRFRAWDEENRDMLSWEQLDNNDKEGMIMLFDLLNGKEKGVIPMQYTGLKDKNGKEIYEGDILQVDERDWEAQSSRNYEVIWGGESNYPAFCLKGYEDLEYNSLQHATEVASCYVVGNIYENPELTAAG